MAPLAQASFPCKNRVRSSPILIPPLYSLIWTCQDTQFTYGFVFIRSFKIWAPLRISNDRNQVSSLTYFPTRLVNLSGTDGYTQFASLTVFPVDFRLHFPSSDFCECTAKARLILPTFLIFDQSPKT